MTHKFLAVGLLASGLIVAAACSADVNTNTAINRASSAVSNAANTLGNAANSIANTISNTTSSVTGSSDSEFIEDVANGGMAEVELGKLASTKAANAEVKKFGQMMVTDHSKANEEFKALAARKGWKLPTELDSSHRATLDDLRNRVGSDFDKAYVDEMVEDHETDVKAFEEKSKNASDPDLRAFAEKTLPVLRKHLDAIKAIQAKMK